MRLAVLDKTILLSFICLVVLCKYNLHKYVNSFKSRTQKYVNKHNPTCGMCFILFLLHFTWPTLFFNEKKPDHDAELKMQSILQHECYTRATGV